MCCGEKTASGLTCNKCSIDEYCEDCGDACDELFEVYDHEYEVRRVCDFCRGEYYTHCVECDSYHPDDMVTEIYNGDFVCKHCLERYYVKCDHCENYYPSYKVHVTEDKNGNAANMCFYCEEKLSSDTEKPKAEDENITPLEKAKQLINEFCETEYQEQADFLDLHNIGLAYTTLTNQEFSVQVTADLIDCEIRYTFNNEMYDYERFDSIEDMVKNGLTGLDFDELTAVPDVVVERCCLGGSVLI